MDVVFTVIYGVIIAPLRENSSDVRPGGLAEGHARTHPHAPKLGSQLAFLPRGPL